jgi:hypothetical protein
MLGSRPNPEPLTASSGWYHGWYRAGTAMNLRLSDEDTEALRA